MSFAPHPTRTKDAETFLEERDKLVQDLSIAAEDIKASRRMIFAEMVTHLRDRLTDDADGKRKKLHETAVTHLQEFIDNYEITDVSNDRDLRAYVDQMRALTQGLDVERLKESKTFRDRIRADMDVIAGELDKLVVAVPGRKMSLE